jgi:hypothetical protein
MSIPSAQLHGHVPRIAHYMAPKQWLGQPVDARSICLAWRNPLRDDDGAKAFDGGNEDEVKQMILEGEPVPPSDQQQVMSRRNIGTRPRREEIACRGRNRLRHSKDTKNRRRLHRQKAAAQPVQEHPNKESQLAQPAATKSVVIQTAPARRRRGCWMGT